MRHFTTTLLFLRNVEELLSLALALLSIGEPSRRGNHSVVVLHDCRNQPARGYVPSGLCHRLSHLRPPVVRVLDGSVNVGVHDELIIVNMRTVIRDEHARGSAVGLRVNELTESTSRRQQGGLCLNAILVRELR